MNGWLINKYKNKTNTKNKFNTSKWDYRSSTFILCL